MSANGFVTVFGFPVNPMAVVLALALASVAYLMWRGQRDQDENTFDIWDLIMDTLEDGKRRASGIKTTYQVAFILTSWVVVDQELKGTLTEGVFGLYLGTWCGSLIAKVVFDKKDPPKMPGGAE